MAYSESKNVLELAKADFTRLDLRRAKDRLRAVLRISPHSQPALVLLGDIYYIHGDHRNALMYWSQANQWNAQTRKACARVFAATARALNRENAPAVRYQLYAFAGCSPPGDLAETIRTYQSAYFQLNEKHLRQARLSYVPMAGGSMLACFALLAVLLGGGWSSVRWVGAFTLAATGIVLGINLWIYLQASKNLAKRLRNLPEARTNT